MLKRCLEQLNLCCHNKGDDFDLLVIDDGSTDNTRKAVQEVLEKEGHSFLFIKRKNAGPAATRNLGVDETKGRYLIFLDADDEMSPNALTHYRIQLGNNISIGMLAGGAYCQKPIRESKKTSNCIYSR